MSGSFDETFLAEVRDKNDILSVVGDYVTLRKAGTSYKGLCPFHGEKTPSFHVHPDRGFFYCFGCQTGGDVITFVREINGYSFPEAVRHLAERVGMTIPERAFVPFGGGGPGGAGAPRAGTASRAARDSFFAINKAAWRFYVDALDTMEGSRCRDYLASRGIERATVERFGLGYAPDRWDGVGQHLAREGFDLRAAETLGLIVARQSGGGGHYDRFRHRLMFPIRNLAGDVIGFSGRTVPGEAQTERAVDGQIAKYVNSPESPVYQKGETIYGLHEARAAMRKAGQAIIVEGNVDLVRLSQAGLEEVVAPLGTALTAAQCRLLKRFVERVVAIYDGDNAGREAARKAATLALAEGLPIAIASLPAKEDPDSFVRANGKDALVALIDKAVAGWEHLVDRTLEETHAVGSAQGAKQAIEKLAPVLASIEDPATRALYERKLGDTLRIDAGEVATIARSSLRRAPQTIGPAVTGPGAANGAVSDASAGPVPPRELALLHAMLTYAPLRPLYFGRDLERLLTHSGARRAAAALADLEGDVASALEALPDDDIKSQLFGRAARIADEGEPLLHFERLVTLLEREAAARKQASIARDERKANLSSDDAMAMKLIAERLKLEKQRDPGKAPQRD